MIRNANHPLRGKRLNASEVIRVFSIVVVSTVLCLSCQQNVESVESKGSLHIELDTSHSFLILASEGASSMYSEAIEASRALHPDAPMETFNPKDLETAKDMLVSRNPYYIQLFMLPGELDVNFGWRWLTMIAGLDDDPFVDTRTGFITGTNPQEATRFVNRIAQAISGELKLPAAMIDNLGPNPQAASDFFNRFPGSYFVPVLGKTLVLQGISHGNAGFKDEWLDALKGAGIVHLGGHGHPDGIDNGLTASQAVRVTLDPCVVLSGVCYTGVCDRSYEMYSPAGTVVEKRMQPENSFCLQLLTNNVIGYLAALHPDHGIPVYQEMEYMARKGASLGEVMKYTYDGVVLGNGGSLPEFELLVDGMKSPQWTPADIMLKGTASRILFGDPSMKIMSAIDAPAPLDISMENRGSVLVVGAIMNNPEYKSLFTDTYHDYIAFQQNMFNDRVVISVELPEGFETPETVKVLGAANGSKVIRNRLQGWGVEMDNGRRTLHVQVDLASTGYMQSEWRNKGAAVGIEVRTK